MGREGGLRERWHYLQQEPAFSPAHAADPQRLMQCVGGMCGDGLEEGEECDEEEAAAERTKKHHRDDGVEDGLYRQAHGGGDMVRVLLLIAGFCRCVCVVRIVN